MPNEGAFMKTFAIVLALVTTAFASAGAQTPPAQGSGQGPMAAWLRGAFSANRDYIARAADGMPEDNYNMRPGAQAEVRTFGQLVGHLAEFNYLWCSQAKGEKNPAQGKYFEKLTTKAELVKAITGALTYCDGVYSAVTDRSGQEMVTITQENGRSAQSLRMSLLVLNYGHNNEHYGNMVTYFRIKNMVPPSSQAR